MAILSKDELNSKLKDILGEDTSDKALAFLEDVTDTFNDLESKGKGDGKDWKAECERIDNEWRNKYKERFFGGDDKEETKYEAPPKASYDDPRADIDIEDLFTERT